jgi:hypothetical protein
MRSCTARTPRCHTARNYREPLRACCRGHIVAMVAAVRGALNEAGVVWWADYGTLLGAVRNPLTTWADYPWLPQSDDPIPPGIVPHDKDADLCAMASDWAKAQRAVRGMAALPGYSLQIRPNRQSMKVRLSAMNRTNVDLFFWNERRGGEMYRPMYIEVDNYKGRDFPRSLLFPLGTVEWEGMTLPAPRDPEEFLAMRYGDTWMTPVAANHDGVRRGVEVPA